jgi:hypothetical protein
MTRAITDTSAVTAHRESYPVDKKQTDIGIFKPPEYKEYNPVGGTHM